MDIRVDQWFRGRSYITYTTCLSVGFISLLAAQTCATPLLAANPSSMPPAIEILALSRGRGVPKATSEIFQVIINRINAALAAGSVTSVTKATIGLEGETRLCIEFRDHLSFTVLSNEFRDIAKDVDLLQINEVNCQKN